LVERVAAVLDLGVELAAGLVVEELLAVLRQARDFAVLSPLANRLLGVVKNTR
jgi:hypothetical protein